MIITRENAKLWLPLMQALADGKTIQMLSVNQWKDVDEVQFLKPVDHYRIKPEPRRWWVNVYPNGHLGFLYNSKEEADFSPSPERLQCIRVIEDLS